MLPVYSFVVHYLGARLGLGTELFVGSDYGQMESEADLAFLCGLPYVELTLDREPPVEPLAAPVLQGDRYGGRPSTFPT